MKKIKLILLLCTITIMANAQEMLPSNQTVISTATKNFVIAPCCAYKAASVQVVATRVSAAMGGSVYFYGSNDGTNYIQLTESTHPEVTNDTLTIGNAATSTVWTYILPAEALAYKYVEAAVKGASSDTMTVKCWFFGRQ